MNDTLAPRDLRDTAFAGKTRPVDPQAVARLKAILAEQAKAPAKPAVGATKASNRLNGSGFNNRLPKREVAKEREEVAMESGLSDDEIIAIHRRYVLENLAVSVLADEVSFSESAVVNQFNRMNLPSRARNRRWVSAEDVAKVCQVHGLKIRDIPVRAMPLPATAAKPKASPVKAAAPVAAVAEPARTAVSPVTGNVSSHLPAPSTTSPSTTSPSTNGTLELPAIHDQLAAVQQLMEMAQAQSVQVSGTILLNLVVEIQLQSGKEVPTPQETK